MMPESSGSRREWIAIAALTILGAVLRFWGTDRLGLDHFDEGIYAFAGSWIADPRGLAGLDPGVIAYSPPGFPILVGLSYLILGIGDLAAIFVSQALGVLTIPVVGWLGRRTFGPGAGTAAAALAAISGPHVAFSRMALTDGPFLLIWLIALGVGGLFLERPGIVRAIGLGLAVAAAQYFKYNGYLAGGIVALTALIGFAEGRDARPKILRALGFGVLAALVAIVAYWPWFAFVRDHGGYAGLLRHQRSYLGGWSAWWPHWRLQMIEAVALSGRLVGMLSWLALAGALAWFGLLWSNHALRLKGESERHGGIRPGVGVLLGLVALGALPGLGWSIGLGMASGLIRDSNPTRRLLAVWWLVMSVLTPFYHPYARLWLPLHAAGWLLIAGLLARVAVWRKPGTDRSASVGDRRRIVTGIGMASVCVGLAAWAQFGMNPRATPVAELLAPRDSLREAVAGIESILKAVAGPRPKPVAVLARPPILYYLAIHGLPFRRYESSQALLKDGGGPGFKVIDESQLDQRLLPTIISEFAVPEQVIPHLSIDYRLSLVSRLDVDPLGVLKDLVNVPNAEPRHYWIGLYEVP